MLSSKTKSIICKSHKNNIVSKLRNLQKGTPIKIEQHILTSQLLNEELENEQLILQKITFIDIVNEVSVVSTTAPCDVDLTEAIINEVNNLINYIINEKKLYVIDFILHNNIWHFNIIQIKRNQYDKFINKNFNSDNMDTYNNFYINNKTNNVFIFKNYYDSEYPINFNFDIIKFHNDELYYKNYINTLIELDPTNTANYSLYTYSLLGGANKTTNKYKININNKTKFIYILYNNKKVYLYKNDKNKIFINLDNKTIYITNKKISHDKEFNNIYIKL